jgi:hypothetical protein
MENKKYSCTECANRRTPVCKVCHTIETPSGTPKRPTYFVPYQMLPPKTAAGSYADIIMRYVIEGIPVPMVLVMKYNQFASEKED